MRTIAIILAAGAASRMGEPKALMVVDGESMLRRAIAAAREAGAEPWVVVGAHSAALGPHLSDVEVVENPRWAEGMGSSIAAGIAAVRELADRVCILAVDQPAIDGRAVATLMNAAVGADAAATRYPSGALGVPAVFSSSSFDALVALEGDRGARALLRDSELRVVAVDGLDPTDIDTPESYRAFTANRAADE